MQQIKISIIIPFFNCGDKINENIVKLQEQNFESFEVIFVNDCSTDNSLQYLKNLLLNSSLNYKIISTTKNSGPGIARNYGLKYAKGEYILFIDADDFIESHSLQILNAYTTNFSYDLICFDFYKVYSNKKNKCKNFNLKHGIINQELLLSICNNGVTRKLIKREIFIKNNIQFPDWRNGEDIFTELKIISNSKNIIYIDNILYNYFQNENSLSNSKVNDLYFYNKLFKVYLECRNSNIEDVYYYNRVALDIFYNTIILFLKNMVDKKQLKEYLSIQKKKYIFLLKKMDKSCFTFKQRVIIYLSFHENINLLYLLEIIRKTNNLMRRKSTK